MRFRGLVFGAVALGAGALAACGGGTAHVPPSLPISAAPGSHAASLTLVLTLPARSTSSVRRLPAYISAATLGASVTETVGATPLTTAFSLAPGAGTCTTSGGANVCTLAVPAPGFGMATVAVKLYDTAPVSGAIPTQGALLSSGTVAATITEGAANVTVPVVLAGIVEGVTAGSPTTLTSAGTASQGTFIVEAVDADANLILASDGASTRTGGAVSLTLTVPGAIAGVTLLDVTTNPAGTPASSITSVSVGDRIQIATGASTPAILGVPVAVYLGTTPIGVARVPTSTSGSPVALSTSYPLSGTEIAGVPPYASFDGVTTGGGFMFLSSSPSLTGFAVNYSLHVPITEFQCIVPGTFTIDHIAVGTYPYLVEASHTSSDVTLNTVGVGTGTCVQGTQAFNSALPPYSAGPAIASWDDAADDGTNIGGALKLSSSGFGQNVIVTTAYNGTVSGGGIVIGSPANQAAIDSLQLWYGKASVLAPGLDQIAYCNATNILEPSALVRGNPVSSAIDGAGNIYIFYNDGSGTVQKCALGAAVTCTTVGSLAAYTPSYDHRAMALGANNKLYIARAAGGFIEFDPVNNTSASNGSTPYKQAVASGDGHVYFLRADGSGVDSYP